MAGLTARGARGSVLRAAWELRRFADRCRRRWGWAGATFVCAATALVASLWVREAQLERWVRANDALALSAHQAPVQPTPVAFDSRAALRAFDKHLLQPQEIPAVLQDLIALAESRGLLLARGTYRPEPEAQGGYLRYRMSLPVTGAPDAIHNFMMTALGNHRGLSLQSVQFKRERSDSPLVEARIQWTLLSRLPPPPSARGNGAVP